MTVTRRDSTAWWTHAVVLIGYAAAALLLTWPLAAHLGDAIPGDGAGDNVTFLWNFWWMRHALATPDTFFHTNALFYPVGVDLVLHTHTALNAFAGATVLGRFTVIEAQNIVIIASYALNGLGAYVLAWTVTRHLAGSIVAGLVFMASPYFTAHLHGHFNLTSAWFIPLYLAALLSALTHRRAGSSVLAGLLLVAAVYSDYYYVVFLIVLTLVMVIVRWLTIDVKLAESRRSFTSLDWLLATLAGMAIIGVALVAVTGGGVATVGGIRISLTSGHNLLVVCWMLLAILAWRRWRPSLRIAQEHDSSFGPDLRQFAIIAAVFLIGAVPVLWLAFQQWIRGDYVSQVYSWRSMPSGIDLISLVSGNPFHPLWGSGIRQLYSAFNIEPIEGAAWLGLVPIASLVALRRTARGDANVRVWLTVAGVFLVWALGPTLIVAGVKTGLWLPEVLLRFVPIASNARIPGRAMVIVYIALAVICAIVVKRLPRSQASGIAAMMIVGVCIDWIAVPFPLYQLRTPALYADVAAAGPGAVLELPLGLRDGFGERGTIDHAAFVHQVVHGKPILGGFAARLSPSVKRYYEEQPVLHTLLDLSSKTPADSQPSMPERASIRAFLIDQQIRFIVVNTALAPPALQQFVREQMSVALVKTEGERQLYIVQ